MANKEELRTVGSSRSSSSHSSIGEDSAGTPPEVQRNTSPGVSPRKPSQGYQCQLCTFIASTQAAFDEHMNIHTGSRPYQCLECGFSCSLHSTLQQHLAVHRIDMTSSILLDRRMPDISKIRDLPPPLMPEVSRGIPLHVSTSGPPPTMEGLNSLSALSPFSEHGRVYQCKLCTHISPTKTHLNEHMNVHSGKKPYKCLVCGFSSAFRSSLMRHLIVHTGTSKQFKCDQCHYQTPYKCNLQAHRRKRHNCMDVNGAPLPPLSMDDDNSPPYNAQNNSSSPSDEGPYKAPLYISEGKHGLDTSGFEHGPPPLAHAMAMQEGSLYDGSDNGIREMEMGNGKIAKHSNISLPHSEIASSETLSPQKASPGSSTGQPQEMPPQESLDFPGSASPHLPSRDVHESDCNHSAPPRSGNITPGSLGMVNNTTNSVISNTPISPHPLPPNENAPHWANFPIFRRKKEGGARKRKRTPFPKRELVLSPEQEHGTELWIDTRSDVPNAEGQAAAAAAYASEANHPLGVKAEGVMPAFHHPQAMVNGIDPSSPHDLNMYKYPHGVVQNLRSPGDVTPDSDENPGHSQRYFKQGVYEADQVINNGEISTSIPQTSDKGNKGSNKSSSSSGGEEDGKTDGQAQTEWIGGDPVGIPHQAVKCPHCETFFTDHVIFTLHMSCHGTRHPFQCSICGYVCRDKIEFTCHVTRSQHIRNLEEVDAIVRD
ncbi:ikaros family zinc finger protein isoform X1 [Strongylocentrotus purpuratus]|uniref:C2H2-type domain-containing protein n=1 Tax=Strongylocentrotus purpuratus TaxID=7668 RepID=A0A7M7NZA3_STRPU|nr:ikaros family zinc finger protein isoform X1 [Strongylocentrotus purpuratus]XP_785645.4 ikaros family zinc finger protein isoform X1 [Strongylocentrotus purpuratus]